MIKVIELAAQWTHKRFVPSSGFVMAWVLQLAFLLGHSCHPQTEAPAAGRCDDGGELTDLMLCFRRMWHGLYHTVRSEVVSMIICSCNVLSDHEVRIAVVTSKPLRTIARLFRYLGCTAQCGRCARSIRTIMDEPHRPINATREMIFPLSPGPPTAARGCLSTGVRRYPGGG